MSFEVVVEKVLLSMKDEIKKDKNMEIIYNDIIKPVVEKVIDHMYPYFVGASLVFIVMFLVIFIILFLNVKICYF